MDIERSIDVLIRARYPILYLVSYEEERVVQCLLPIARKWNKQLLVWSLVRGMQVPGQTAGDATRDPSKALEYIENYKDPAIFALRDFDAFL